MLTSLKLAMVKFVLNINSIKGLNHKEKDSSKVASIAAQEGKKRIKFVGIDENMENRNVNQPTCALNPQPECVHGPLGASVGNEDCDNNNATNYLNSAQSTISINESPEYSHVSRNNMKEKYDKDTEVSGEIKINFDNNTMTYYNSQPWVNSSRDDRNILTVKSLKQMLKVHGIMTSGVKAVLIERLLGHFAQIQISGFQICSSNPAQTENNEPEWSFNFPRSTVTKRIPQACREQVSSAYNSLLRNVINLNHKASWEKLLPFPRTVLGKHSKLTT